MEWMFPREKAIATETVAHGRTSYAEGKANGVHAIEYGRRK